MSVTGITWIGVFTSLQVPCFLRSFKLLKYRGTLSIKAKNMMQT